MLDKPTRVGTGLEGGPWPSRALDDHLAIAVIFYAMVPPIAHPPRCARVDTSQEDADLRRFVFRFLSPLAGPIRQNPRGPAWSEHVTASGDG